MEGIHQVSISIGLPVSILLDDEGLVRVTVDIADLPGELARAVSEGSATVQVMPYSRREWRDADESEVDDVAQYVEDHVGVPWVEVPDAPGWDPVPDPYI